MMRPKVLVLLAAYNGSAWIAEQVQSILQQAGVDVHVVISDDRSTDGTQVQLGRFASDPRVSVVSPPAATGSAAQNFFWLMSQTPVDGYEFVSFADQDDLWHEEKLTRACSCLAKDGAQGYSCAVTAMWASGRRATLRQVGLQTVSDFLFEGAGQGCTFVISEIFYRRLRSFLAANYPSTGPIHYHDWAIYAVSRAWQLPWVFDPTPMMQYRQHGQNDTGARLSLAGVNKRLRLIKNGWYQRQISAIAHLCQLAAPSDALIAQWIGILAQSPGLRRRYRMARFCLQGGRRRLTDRALLLAALVMGP